MPSLREAAAGCTACELYKMSEITACKPWLEAEMKVVKPPALELKAFTEDLARVAREL